MSSVSSEGTDRGAGVSLSAWYSRIDALEADNLAEEAVEAARQAILLFPAEPLLRTKYALILPILYRSNAELDTWRDRWLAESKKLAADWPLTTPEQCEAALAALRYHVNFYLAYQPVDQLEPQRFWAGLISRTVQAKDPRWTEPVPVPDINPDGRLRIAFISARLRRHSVSKSHIGWMVSRSRQKIEAYVYQMGHETDETTRELAAAADCFRQLDRDLASQVAAIRADRVHAAIFLDVGMEPSMALLSATRVAPVQCATWGHPVTTGSPNIDHYLSSELMEPPEGDSHYSETLIRLPGIGCHYRKPLIPRAVLDTSRQRFGLTDENTVYLCCQSLYKYLPQHDHLWVEIAQRVPAARFVFVSMRPAWAEFLRSRLNEAFASAGLSADLHCVFLPSQPLFDYWALNLSADVYLDSVDWNGFNTTMEAIACGLPVVTLPGQFMRGRHGLAIMTQLGITETVARDKADYVDIAVRLGQNTEFRRALAARMTAAHSRLYGDHASVDALESFLTSAVADAAAAAPNICRDCGFCCDGTLFDEVVGAPSETPATFIQLGLIPLPSGKGFSQPCSRFNGSCSIYSTRPHSCAAFQCPLLNSVDDHSISIREAAGIISDAKALRRSLGPSVDSMAEKLSGRSFVARLASLLPLMVNPEAEDFRRANAPQLNAARKLLGLLRRYFVPAGNTSGGPA